MLSLRRNVKYLKHFSKYLEYIMQYSMCGLPNTPIKWSFFFFLFHFRCATIVLSISMTHLSRYYTAHRVKFIDNRLRILNKRVYAIFWLNKLVLSIIVIPGSYNNKSSNSFINNWWTAAYDARMVEHLVDACTRVSQ